MKLYGLIGYPLSHSFSGKYFAGKFEKEKINDSSYKLFPIDSIDKFLDIIKNNPDLIGLNVTIPYKESVIPFLDEIDSDALSIGAVNTIKVININNKKILKGFNTDVYGFETSLTPLLNNKHKKALVLGCGGAAKAIAWVLNKLNIDFSFVTLDSEYLKDSKAFKDYNIYKYSEINNNKHLIADYNIVINTTPLGTYPNIDTCPEIPYELINSDYLLFDLTYNPEKTKFLLFGESKNAIIKNGLEMLYLQAEKAWEIWQK